MQNNRDLIHGIWDQLGQNFSKNTSELGVDIRKLRDSIFCPGPYYYYIVDFSKRECTYVHESVNNFFGIAPEDFSFERVIGGIHPDDIPHTVQCEKVVHQFLYEVIQAKDITSYKVNYCFRMRNKDDEYRMISHQALTLSTDNDGRISHVLNIHTDVSHLVSANNQKISFLGLNKRPSFYGIDPYHPDFEKSEPKVSYTKRELELIKLSAEGLSAEDIGKRLFIAPDTVRTHRRNIIKKSGCRNTVQVISKCVREGII